MDSGLLQDYEPCNRVKRRKKYYTLVQIWL